MFFRSSAICAVIMAVVTSTCFAYDTGIEAIHVDTSNPVFDVYFLGDGGGAWLQNKNGTSNYKQLNTWGSYNPYDVATWGDIKAAVMVGINRWTNTISNRLRDGQQKLKVAINFGSNADTLIAGSEAVALFNHVEWSKTSSFAKTHGYNSQTAAEAYLRDGNTTFANNSGTWQVAAEAGCVDIVLTFNLSNIQESATQFKKELVKVLAATTSHELGHAMGVSTTIYATAVTTVIYDQDGSWDREETTTGNIVDASNMTKLDSLLCLKDADGNLTRLASLDTENGKVVPSSITNFNGIAIDLKSGNSLAKVGNGPLVLAEKDAGVGDPTLKVLNTIGDLGYVGGSSYEHLFILVENYQHDIMGTYSSTLEFSENDLLLFRMLGYTLTTQTEEPVVSQPGMRVSFL